MLYKKAKGILYWMRSKDEKQIGEVISDDAKDPVLPSVTTHNQSLYLAALVGVIVLSLGAFMYVRGDLFRSSNSTELETNVQSELDQQPVSDTLLEEEKVVEEREAAPPDAQPGAGEGAGLEEAEQTKEDAELKMTFTFYDTSNWKTITAADGSYSLKIGSGYAVDFCPDDQSVTATHLAYLDSMGSYECDGLSEAMYKEGQNYVYGLNVFGRHDGRTYERATSTVAVVLENGLEATRYEYESDESVMTLHDQTWDFVEYVTEYKGVVYAARMNRINAGDPRYSKYDVSDVKEFDTIVQKTWVFN